MTARQIQAVRAEYLRRAAIAREEGKSDAAEAFDHAAEILMQARINAMAEDRVAARTFLAERQGTPAHH